MDFSTDTVIDLGFDEIPPSSHSYAPYKYTPEAFVVVVEDVTYYCICGLPVQGGWTDGGAFCGPKCERVAKHMYRDRAKQDSWMMQQKARMKGLQAALDECRPHYTGVAGLL